MIGCALGVVVGVLAAADPMAWLDTPYVGTRLAESSRISLFVGTVFLLSMAGLVYGLTMGKRDQINHHRQYRRADCECVRPREQPPPSAEEPLIP